MRILIITLTAFLAIPSSASAVRRVEKKPKKQSSSAVQAKQEAGKPSVSSDKDMDTSQSKRPPMLESGGQDRFIDENSDGINDRIEKKQTIRIKKRDSRESEKQRPETPKKESDKKSGSKSRRDR